MDGKTIRWGMIGCGKVTEKKSGPAFQKARNSALVAVMSRTAEKARDYAARHRIPRWYDNAEQLIADPEVDAVYIATPPSEHKKYTLMCARAGKPVYVEKPMARSYNECEEMIGACREANVPLFVAYYRRALAKFIKIKEWVESGRIGTVRFVNIVHYQAPHSDDLDSEHLPWRVLPRISGGGRFVDLGSHTLDILDFILGPIEEVRGTATNQAGLYPAEDIVIGSFVFRSGCLGSGTWCFTAYQNFERNEIVGTRGKITFTTFGNDPVLLSTNEGHKRFKFKLPVHIQQPLIQTVVDALNGEGNCPSDGISAARTNWVMDELLKDWRCRKVFPE